MANIDFSKPQVLIGFCVEFTYNDNGSTVTDRWVRGEDEITDTEGIGTWFPAPEMEVEMNPQHAGIRSEPWKVRMKSTYEPLATASQSVWVPCEVAVYDIDLVSGDITPRLRGTLHSTKKFTQNRVNMVEAEISSRKERLSDVPLGIVASDDCVWTLGESPCAANLGALAAFTPTAVVDSIDGSTITITPDGDYDVSGNYYRKGYIDHEGRRIAILGSEATKLRLAFPPPPHWVGRTINITRGCDKTPDDCAVFNAQSTYMGIGRLMAARNPLLEAGGGS